jgi:glycosyltransferase involved in cell wall biosynthesis
MAAGKPVIVPDVAAMPETAGDSGQVYRAGVLTELSDKIGLLSGDKALYSSLCSRAVERARGFSIEKVLEDYMSLVLEVGRAEREEMAQSIRGSR